MGFDWKSFATGFMETTAENIKERKDEAREYEKEQKDLAERNLLTISKRRAVANQVVGLTNMLRENGASDKVIQAAIAAGPKQIATLASKVDEARGKLGRNLSSADIDTLIAVPEDFSPIDMTTEDFINRTYGLGYEGVGAGTVEKPELSLRDRFTGRKQMDLARARLDSQVIQDGYTAYDINQLAAQQDYESLVPGTFVSFNELKVFNPATDMADFTRTISSLAGDVQDSAAFKQIETEIQQTTFSEDLDEEQKAVRIAELEKKRDALYLSTVAPTINSMVETYGESFVDSTEGYLRTFLSDAYVDSLLVQPEVEEEEATPDEAEVIAAETMSVLNEPAVASRIITPEVTVTELPDAPRAEDVPIPQDAAELPEPQESDTVSVEGSGTYSYADWKGMSRSERTAAGLPTSLIGAQFYFNRFSVGITGEKSGQAAETVPVVEEVVPEETEDDSGVTYAEWKAMPRKEREDKGYPVSTIGGEMYFKRFAVGLGLVDSDQRFDSKVEEEPLEDEGIEPDDLSVAILKSDGVAIMDYLKAEGVTSEEEMAIAISEWGQKNSKTIPLDKGVLIYALKPHVLEQ